MKELLLELFSMVLEAPKVQTPKPSGQTSDSVSPEDQQAGTALPTRGGRWRAKQVGTNKILYWGDQEVAVAWAKGQRSDDGGEKDDAKIGGMGKEDPQLTAKKQQISKDLQGQFGEKPETSPEQQAQSDAKLKMATKGKASKSVEIERDEAPAEPAKYVDGVDDRLDKTVTSDALMAFEQTFPKNDRGMADALKKLKIKQTGVGVTSEEVEAVMGITKDNPAKCPPKYISVLSTLLNHGDGYRITDITGTAGAGTLDSTSGEIISLMGLSIEDDNQREKFFQFIEQKIVEGKKQSPITAEWVKSARATASAFSRKLKRDCPSGHKIVSAFWDVQAEAKTAGVKNYKQTKGKSTDVNAVVDCIGKDGKPIRKWYQPSLKKDKKVNGFNGSTSRVFSVMVYQHGTLEQIEKYDALGNELDSFSGVDPKQRLTDGSNKTVAQRKTEIGKEMEQMERELSKGRIPPNADVEGVKRRQQELHQAAEQDPAVVKELDETITQWSTINKTKDKAERERRRREFLWDIMEEMNQGVQRKSAAKKPPNSLEQEISHILDELVNLSGTKRLSQTPAGETGDVLPTLQQHFNVGGVNRDRMKLNVELLSASIVGQRKKGKDPTKSASYQHKKKTDDNSRNHAKAVLQFLTGTRETRTALLRSISTAFPLKDLMEGRENVIMGENRNPPDGINLDAYTISKCLAADSFEQVVERLTIVNVDGDDMLVYSAGDEKHVPIGLIRARPDGISYGENWKLEMNIHSGFSDCCAEYDK